MWLSRKLVKEYEECYSAVVTIREHVEDLKLLVHVWVG